jgi:proteasome lid subunit RPN8/RPN11
MKYSNWIIPRHVVEDTARAFLRGAHEVFVIWPAALRDDAGSAGSIASITRCIVPAQKPGIAANGVWVHVEGPELQRIQLDNHRRGERSIVQLHTHPGDDVTMSALDREWEVVRHVGALSIIVPNYGKRGMGSFVGVNVYEREESDWRRWSRGEVEERLVVV